MKRIILFLLVVALLATASANAQSGDDFGIWTSIGVTKSVNKKLTLGAELENRTKYNVSKIARWGLGVDASYKLSSWLRGGASYQYQHYFDSDYGNFQPRHRVAIFLQGKYEWHNWSLSLRERIQVTTKDESERITSSGTIDSYKVNPAWVWRNRLKAEYNISNCPITPFASAETFYQINVSGKFDGLRYNIGVDWKLNKHNTLTISGVNHCDINQKASKTERRWVLALGYTYRLK